jgi:hypothetical protein
VIGLGTTVAVAGNADEKNAAGSASDARRWWIAWKNYRMICNVGTAC